MDYVKKKILEVEKPIVVEAINGNKGIKRWWIDSLKEWVYMEPALISDFLKLYRFIGDKIVIYQTDSEVSKKFDTSDVTILFKSIVIFEYNNTEQLDDITVINLCKDFLSGLIYKDYFSKNYNFTENRITILEIIKEKNNTKLLLAHDLYNNNLLVLPEHIEGMKNKPEIGSVYMGHFETYINLNTFSIKPKLLGIVKELDKINIYSYLNKYYDCYDYPYLDFNKINEDNIKENYYFLVRFSNSIVKKYKGKYQLKLGTKFIDLESYSYLDFPEIEGKLYRGIALLKAIKIKNRGIKYIAIKLFNKFRDIDDSSYLNKRSSSKTTLSGIDIEDVEHKYYIQEELYNKNAPEDLFEHYDVEPDDITSSYLEYNEYDNEGEDFMAEFSEEIEDFSYFDSYYDSGERSYNQFSETRNFILPDPFDMPNNKEFIQKNYNDKFYFINDVHDLQFTSNYEIIDLEKCTISLNTFTRLEELRNKENNILK